MTETPVLERLVAAGVLEPLDLHFARTLGRLAAPQPEAVLLGAALASRAVGLGHVCVDLRRIVDRPVLDAEGQPLADVALPPLFEWVMALGQTPLCGDGSQSTPLVFDGEARLYLTRYFRYQRALAEDLDRRARDLDLDVDLDAMVEPFGRAFPRSGADAPDVHQRLAGAAALLRRLAVITGGPGTGKTTTVVRLLALLVEQALGAGRPPPRIVLLAPTGKAAARLGEAVATGVRTLPIPETVAVRIPTEASTIHRRLGYRPGSPTRFFHDAENPLPADVVLVDEASMVDLALMAKLVDAVPRRARLVLLGDKDQLASVEAGAILGDICNTGEATPYSRAFIEQAGRLVGGPLDVPSGDGPAGGIGDCVVELTRSFRFRSDGGIGRLARAVNAGDADEAIALLHSGDPQVRLEPLEDERAIRAVLMRDVVPEFRRLLEADDPEGRLAALAEYRLLAAHRRGRFGTERINALVEELLIEAGLVPAGDPAYPGRPILVTANDHQLALYNGDVGVLHGDADGHVRAYFAGTDGRPRAFASSRLPPHESVYAMTVHKSQGSEFDRVGLLVPPAVSPVLTRELVYTGITRARSHVVLYGTPDVLTHSIARRIDRASGLRDALWRPPE
jgi:exodeoxyribonuclease V alpha subunit